MSRIAKKPVIIPDGVKIAIEGRVVKAKGPKGENSFVIPEGVEINLEDGKIIVALPTQKKDSTALHGLVRTLLNNCVEGVSRGFEKKLEIVGTGYRAEMAGKDLRLLVGFSHPVVFQPLPDIEFSLENPTKISVKGINKEIVGQIAAKIRAIRPPEPYNGKGIKYEGEYVRRKAGKSAA